MRHVAPERRLCASLRPELSWLVAGVAAVVILSAWALPARGQDSPAEDPAGTESPAEEDGLGGDEEGGTDLETIEDKDLEAIEDLLAQDESVLSNPETYSYDPGSRRDPFRSLIETRNSRDEEPRERPEGKAGLLIDEIVIEGVFELADGPVAQIQSASEETSYLLRPGDQLWDGDVISITLEEVVFKQVVEDPTALRPFREVVKRLNPLNP